MPRLNPSTPNLGYLMQYLCRPDFPLKAPHVQPSLAGRKSYFSAAPLSPGALLVCVAVEEGSTRQSTVCQGED